MRFIQIKRLNKIPKTRWHRIFIQRCNLRLEHIVNHVYLWSLSLPLKYKNALKLVVFCTKTRLHYCQCLMQHQNPVHFVAVVDIFRS